MIRIVRGTAPTAFGSQELADARREAQEFFGQPRSKRAQRRFKFRGLTAIAGIHEALCEHFFGKCAYCERLLEPHSGLTVDRFRSPSGVVNADGTFDPDHYWWLAYEWFNIYPACELCNSMKGNRFPLAGARAKIGAAQADLYAEQALLLDPCADQPEQHLVFSKDGTVASETPQGRTTIDVLGLNRSGTVQDRRDAYAEAEALLKSTLAMAPNPGTTLETAQLTSLFAQLYSSQQPYAALRRQVLMQWLNQTTVIDTIGRQPSSQALQALLSDLSDSDRENVLGSLSETTRRKLRLQPPAGSDGQSWPPSSQAPGIAAQSVSKTGQHEQAIVKRYQAEQAGAESYSIEDEAGKQQYYRKRRIIERLELHNFKGIRDLSLSFGAAQPAATPCLLLLGENGTGKSTILQAIALTLMGAQHRAELHNSGLLDAARFLRYGARSGYVKIYFLGILEPVELQLRKNSDRFESSATDPQIPLLGYGATRLLPRSTAKLNTEDGLARTQNLFDPFVPLHDADAWLGGLPKAQFDRAARGLKELMLLDDDDRLYKTRNREIKARTFGGSVPLRDLSDGYQTVIALTVDIMSVMQRRWETMEIAEGIVLVDELDAHLHPRWKMQIIRRLRQTFPRIQFIVTSHDPLCLRGFGQQEVVVMQRDAEDAIVGRTDLPDPNGLRIDQILTSEFFGLNSTVDPDVERLFNEYYELLALRQPTEQQSARLTELKGQLEQRELLGTNQRERLMLEAADQFVANQSKEPDPARRLELHDDARNLLVDLWSALDLPDR